MKPFIETLRVTNPVRQSRASSREVSLAWGRVTVTTKRSEIKRCVIEPRIHRREPSSWSVAGAAQGELDLGSEELPGHTGVGGTFANDRTGFTGTWEILAAP